MSGSLLRQAIAVALIAWALAASIERLLAYVVNRPRWPTNAVTYFVNPANADVTPENALAAKDDRHREPERSTRLRRR